ncbi:hypothetical protein OG225_43475 (plasmid) [Nocardia sp. NBC_01377]|uniref:hypothetical protein n=1 Tax=Nocardia sp. NBC_01377 TaxID=2903595 RepID=UPI002F90B864
MYSYEQADEVGQVLAGMPIELLEYFAELIAFLELTPWTGRPFQPRNPEGNLRKMVFGPNSEALLVYLILEEQRRVVGISLIWLD